MALAICSMCFKRKDVTVVYPETEPVCRGCFMDLDRATGWLEHAGYGLIHGASGLVLGLEGIQTRQDGLKVSSLPRSGSEAAVEAADDNPPDPPEPPVVIPPKAKGK